MSETRQLTGRIRVALRRLPTAIARDDRAAMRDSLQEIAGCVALLAELLDIEL